MSFLVELPREVYPTNALDRLDTTATEFKLENAQAMMWLSQLAYETANMSKIDDILKSWHMKRLALGSNNSVTGLSPESACFIVAEGRGATIVTFSGTDPLKIQDWIKDFNVEPKPDVLHAGFEQALDAVWPTIEALIRDRPNQPLFFTGHSMGAALALLGAERALNRVRIMSTGVHVFGSPRTGGLTFFNLYGPKLAERTFRLVHGHDIVPTVPPSLNGNFRHVGHLLRCRSGGTFAGVAPEPPDQNEPDFIDGLLNTVVEGITSLGSSGVFARVGALLHGPLINLLPPMVLDHIPASYFKALSIRLG